MENLRDLLSTYNASQKLLIGCGLTHEDKDSKIVFPSGGAGYVLSRGALTAFANKVQSEKPSSKDNDDSDPPKPRGCGLDGGSLGEDLRLAICMRTVGVKFIDGQHPNGTFRFLPSMLEYFVFPDRMGAISWLADQRQFVQVGDKKGNEGGQLEQLFLFSRESTIAAVLDWYLCIIQGRRLCMLLNF